MKRAILLVSFGTSYRDAREGSLENIRKDLEQSGKIPVYQAYTSGMIIRKLFPRGFYRYGGRGVDENTRKSRQASVCPSHAYDPRNRVPENA